ncbi:hypothetical protein KQI84_16275 [bacterium]|nr:hypothetical protein [bacterium]
MGDIGIVQWLPFAILGFVLSVGYVVMRFMQSRQKGARPVRKKRERQSELERELQAEIDAARQRQAGTSAAVSEPEGPGALDLPEEEKARLAQIRQRVESAENAAGREE